MAVDFTIYGGLVQLSGTTIEIEVTNDDVQGDSPRALLRATSQVDATTGKDQIEGGPFEDSKSWTDGMAIFDFSEYFDAPAKFAFTYPGSSTLAIKHPSRAFNLDILAGESHEDENGDKQENWQDAGNAVAIRILKGGLSQWAQAKYNEAGTNFYEDFILGNKFLTDRPDNQKISPSQPVRLWYLLPGEDPVDYNLVVDYIDAAGDENIVNHAITIDPDGLYEFVVDPASLGLPTGVKQYTIYLADGDTQITDSRTFIIDYSYYTGNNTFVLFSNRYSGIDDAWFTGEVKLIMPHQAETGQQKLDRTATTQDPSLIVTSQTGQRKWTIAPGNRISKQQALHLQDLIYAKHRWLLVDGEIIPVTLESGDKNITDTANPIYGDQTLTFVEAHQNYFR